MAEDALGTVLENLTEQFGGLDATFYTVAAVTGLLLVGTGLFRLRAGQNSGQGAGRAIGLLVTGCILFSMQAFVESASLSLFAGEAQLTSRIPAAGGILAPYVRFAVTVVVLLGIYSMIRGVLRLGAAAQGREEAVWSGLAHLLAGVVCVNIVTFARFFGASCGGVVEELVTALFS